MALPGLQLNISTAIEEEKHSITHELQPGSEWRFEAAFGEGVDIKLLAGTAELFGTELALNQVYSFNGRKAAIYTWHGCRLEITGKCQADYVAEETPMDSYANLHFALENLRQLSTRDNTLGPRVLVVGPENAGKTTLVKILAAYATRSGGEPLVVNLDPKEGMLSVPGTMSAVALESIIDVEEGWGSSPTNGPSQIPVKLPLVYYYGSDDPIPHAEIYKPIATRLALSVMSRTEEDSEAKSCGCIIDSPGSITLGKAGYDIIQHIVAEFAVNVLVILGSERLYSEMSRRFSKQTPASPDSVSIVKLDKSGGCVDRDDEYLAQFRLAQIRDYFFGDVRNSLSPHTQQLDYSEVVIYRISEKSSLMHSLLPGGEVENAADDAIYDKVEPSSLMQHCMLAIVQAEPDDREETIRESSVIGFVYVAEVDETKKKIRILAPLSGRLPRKAMIWGLWPESAGDLVG